MNVKIHTAFLSEKNSLLCLIRSHSEIKEGCGMSHEGCYTVYSAPSLVKNVLGGIMEIKGKHLTKDGHIFQECTEEEIQDFKSNAVSVFQ